MSQTLTQQIRHLSASEDALAAQFTAAADALAGVGRTSLPAATARLRAEAEAARDRLAEARAVLAAELAGVAFLMDELAAEIADGLADSTDSTDSTDGLSLPAPLPASDTADIAGEPCVTHDSDDTDDSDLDGPQSPADDLAGDPEDPAVQVDAECAADLPNDLPNERTFETPEAAVTHEDAARSETTCRTNSGRKKGRKKAG